MRLATKERVVHWSVAVFLVWPLVHFCLVQSHDINPWKLGGWAMYVQPRLDTFVQIRELRGERQVALPQGELPTPIVAALGEYQRRWNELGSLVDPDRVARLMLATRSDAEGVVIATRKWAFDADSASFAMEEVQHLYRRTATGQVATERRLLR